MSDYQSLCWDCHKPLSPEREVVVQAGHPAVTRGTQAVCAECALKRAPIDTSRWFRGSET